MLTLSIILATCVDLTHGQAVFQKYGFNKKPLTLSKGKYNEFFTNEEVVQIGTVRFNTRTNKVIELLEEDTTKTNYLSDRSSIWYSVDPLAEKFPNYSPYVYCANNPIKYVDPDGRKLQIANTESFSVLLSSLPKDVRSVIQLDNNGFITNASVDLALSQYSNSGNLQALKVIVDDNRTVEFDATKTQYEYIDIETGETKPYSFSAPRSNDYDDLLSLFQGTPEQKQMYAEHLKKLGIDNDAVSGNLGATLRPKNQQEPYPGGEASQTDNFKVFVSPVGTTRSQKSRNVGHELFSHLYFFFTGRDPRHGGETNTINGNIGLDQQINARELESEQNSLK